MANAYVLQPETKLNYADDSYCRDWKPVSVGNRQWSSATSLGIPTNRKKRTLESSTSMSSAELLDTYSVVTNWRSASQSLSSFVPFERGSEAESSDTVDSDLFDDSGDGT